MDILVRYIWQNYGIYLSIGYIKQKLRDVLGKIMGYTMGYIIQNLRGILGKTMGYVMGYNWQYVLKNWIY